MTCNLGYKKSFLIRYFDKKNKNYVATTFGFRIIVPLLTVFAPDATVRIIEFWGDQTCQNFGVASFFVGVAQIMHNQIMFQKQ